jgi:hypothetical protein
LNVPPNKRITFKTYVPKDGGVWKFGLHWMREPLPETGIARRYFFELVPLLHLPKALENRIRQMNSPINRVISPPFRGESPNHQMQ